MLTPGQPVTGSCRPRRLAGAAGDGARRLAVVRVVAGDRRRGQGDGSVVVEDASAVGGGVAGHLAVIQGQLAAGQGHRAGQRYAVGDAAAVAACGVVVHLAVDWP